MPKIAASPKLLLFGVILRVLVVFIVVFFGGSDCELQKIVFDFQFAIQCGCYIYK